MEVGSLVCFSCGGGGTLNASVWRCACRVLEMCGVEFVDAASLGDGKVR